MLVSIRAFANNDVFACGDYGYVRHFNGSSWSLYELETPSPLQAIDGVAPDDLWVCGAGGFMAHFNGSAWEQVPSVTTGDISALHVIAADEIYGVTRQGEVIFFDGDKWNRVVSPSLAMFNDVFRTPENVLWLVGDNGVVMSYGPDPECERDGDVNQDGTVTSADAQMAFYIVIGTIIPDELQECAADCNGDMLVTAGDAQAIFWSVLGTGSCVE